MVLSLAEPKKLGDGDIEFQIFREVENGNKNSHKKKNGWTPISRVFLLNSNNQFI